MVVTTVGTLELGGFEGRGDSPDIGKCQELSIKYELE